MAALLQFVIEHEVWFTRILLVGAALMLLGFLFAAKDYYIYRREKSLLEDVAYVAMWRYGLAVVFFLVLAGGVQVVLRAAPDGHFVLSRLWNPQARSVIQTPTPTPTPIPVPNLIPTPTPTATPTPTPTATPTVTPTPTATPVPVLHAGGRARVLAETLNVRSGPGTKFDRVGVLLQNQEVDILGGPEEADGYRWWQIRTEEGISGWVAEGTGEVTWIEPLP